MVLPHPQTPTPPNALTPPVLTAEAMRAADRFTIEDYGLPGFTLMESAGRGAADRIAAHFGPLDDQLVAIYCGKGNNGGDGLVVARQLHARGVRIRAIVLGGTDKMSRDASRNLELLRQLQEADDEDHLRILQFENLSQLSALRPADLHVDALLGTGLTSELRDPILSLAGWLNEQPQPKVAIDLPTGLHSDIGTILGDAVHADLTVTMAAHKAGLLMGKGPQVAGRVEVAEIGIPAFALEEARQKPGCATLTTDTAVKRWLPRRAHDAYKYSVGLALVVAGAPGMTGAPIMSSLAAARAGAGYVMCACPASVQTTLASKLTEVTTLALPEADGGGLAPSRALDALSDRLDRAQALLVGPGLGRKGDTPTFVRELLLQSDQPAIIDADGLNALDAQWLADNAEGRWILTPHAGEFKRLAGSDVDLSDRLRTAQEYARRFNSVLLLKGAPSIVAGPDGQTYICSTGNPALATAGTGDVLAGLCAGFLAQGLAPLCAAACALHLGGAAADRYAKTRDVRTMVATDLLDQLPTLLHESFT